MTLSSPKRLAIDKRMAPRAALLSGLVFALGLSANGAAQAALHSSPNYAIESETLASGGGRAISTGYILSGTVGQSSALGAGTSASYAALPGFQSTLDGDRDGYPDHLDAFPSDPTEQLDTDGDGTGNNADLDDDGDGMPDTWEDTYPGLDSLVADAGGDVDSDGYSNLEEYLAGTLPNDPLSRPMQVVDFFYDFHSEILWRHNSDGRANVWQMDGFTKTAASEIGNPGPIWKIEGVGDFDNDGHADILWRNSSTNGVSIWLMNGFAKTNSGPVGSAGSAWVVAGVADFDGNGTADVLWRNTTNGQTNVWQIDVDGLTKSGAATLGSPILDWVIAGVGDFDDDGISDVLWRNTVNGNNLIWDIDAGLTKTDRSLANVSTPWSVEGVGDFNGDGTADIMWRNASNWSINVWEMGNFLKTDAATIGTVDPAVWQVARLGDYNGDGQGDILWRKPADGKTSIWQMTGLVRGPAAQIGTVVGWSVE